MDDLLEMCINPLGLNVSDSKADEKPNIQDELDNIFDDSFAEVLRQSGIENFSVIPKQPLEDRLKSSKKVEDKKLGYHKTPDGFTYEEEERKQVFLVFFTEESAKKLNLSKIMNINEFFCSFFAGRFCNELKRKCNLDFCHSHVHERWIMKFKKIPRLIYTPTVINQFCWNKENAVVMFSSSLTNMFYTSPFSDLSPKEFNWESFENREMTKEEKKFYKKNISTLFFNALKKSCRCEYFYNGYPMQYPKFSKKIIDNSFELKEENEIFCCFDIEVHFKTKSGDDNYGLISLYYSFDLARKIKDNISGIKRRKNKSFQNFSEKNVEKKIPVKVQLGTTTMSIDKIKNIQQESAFILDNNVTDLVDVFADGKLVARGEPVIQRYRDKNLSVRITEFH